MVLARALPAYNRYVLDVSQKGDLLDNRVVTAPCLLGYGEVGARLVNATEGVDRNEETNPYWGWIKEYGGDWYQGAVQTGIGEPPSLARALKS
jgi:hydroxymethylpyrimidine/phosphomethylpyrimidine kinase / thiaminase